MSKADVAEIEVNGRAGEEEPPFCYKKKEKKKSGHTWRQLWISNNRSIKVANKTDL